MGCRRCGGGLAGEPFVSNVAEGVVLANELSPGLIVLEGSGAALPPVGSDAGLLVAGAHQPIENVAGYLGTYRLLMSDAVVLTMAEEPLATVEKVRSMTAAVRQIKPSVEVVPVVFRPRPLEEVRDRRVAFFTTAPAEQGGGCSRGWRIDGAVRSSMFLAIWLIARHWRPISPIQECLGWR